MSELPRAARARHPGFSAALVIALALAVIFGGRGSAGPVTEVEASFAPSQFATTLGGDAHRSTPRPPVKPSRQALRKAERFASSRAGAVSFAVVDSRGRLRGWDAERQYVSASIVKAPLMVAELRRIDQSSAKVDQGTVGLLRAMITHSDNSSADAVYFRNRDAGLYDVARRTGMRRFTVAGHWGNAQVTAADLARFFSQLDRALPRTSRRLAHELLADVVPDQRWGIPAAAEPAWSVELKGGWRATGTGQLVHQAAYLERGSTEIALAVLTDGQPSQAYGRETVQAIAERLLSRPIRRSRGA